MDQDKGKGHHAITKESARQLFEKTAVDDHGTKRIDGMDFEQYYAQLDAGQEYADRNPLAPFTEADDTFGWGNTWQPYWMNPDAQREHSTADPAKSGEQNLEDIRNFVTGELEAAKADHDAFNKFDKLDSNHDGFLSHKEIDRGIKNKVLTGRAASNLKNNQDDIEDLHDDPGIDDLKGVSKADLQAQEMRDLGKATHDLEDSYSNAHMFRDKNDPSPHARVENINTFDWSGRHDTHDERFDEVPLNKQHQLVRSSDKAAAAGTAEMLEDYYKHRDDPEAAADTEFREKVGSFYQGRAPEDGGVKVNFDNHDPNWQSERNDRLQIEEQEQYPYLLGDYPMPPEDTGMGQTLEARVHSSMVFLQGRALFLQQCSVFFRLKKLLPWVIYPACSGVCIAEPKIDVTDPNNHRFGN